MASKEQWQSDKAVATVWKAAQKLLLKTYFWNYNTIKAVTVTKRTCTFYCTVQTGGEAKILDRHAVRPEFYLWQIVNGSEPTFFSPQLTRKSRRIFFTLNHSCGDGFFCSKLQRDSDETKACRYATSVQKLSSYTTHRHIDQSRSIRT